MCGILYTQSAVWCLRQAMFFYVNTAIFEWRKSHSEMSSVSTRTVKNRYSLNCLYDIQWHRLEFVDRVNVTKTQRNFNVVVGMSCVIIWTKFVEYNVNEGGHNIISGWYNINISGYNANINLWIQKSNFNLILYGYNINPGKCNIKWWQQYKSW